MAGASGGKGTSVSDRLREEPHRFDFFQAVHLLERLAAAASEQPLAGCPVGGALPPEAETVRFRAHQSATFQPAAVVQYRDRRDATAGRKAQTAELVVSFLGLTGSSGALPLHYSSLVLERRHARYRDYTLQEFFDLVNHRTIAFFYRIWEKYRFPVPYERAHRKRSSDAVDLFTDVMFCLTGLGTPKLRNRMVVDDEVVIYYSGLFAQKPRTMVSLRQLLVDYFELPIEVEQFVPQWLELSPDNRSSLPSPAEPNGRNMGFGRGMVLGARVLNVEHKIRLRVGPLSYAQFLDFLPPGTALKPLSQLARLYVGPQYDVEVQLVLKAAEVPCAMLDEENPSAAVGWNTWIQLDGATEDSEDVVFTVTEFGDS